MQRQLFNTRLLTFSEVRQLTFQNSLILIVADLYVFLVIKSCRLVPDSINFQCTIIQIISEKQPTYYKHFDTILYNSSLNFNSNGLSLFVKVLKVQNQEYDINRILLLSM